MKSRNCPSYRNRAAESFSGEILSKSASKHTRNKSDVLLLEGPTSPTSPAESSPASAVHKWFSNILKPNSNPSTAQQPNPEPTAQTVSPLQPVNRRSRFQNDPSSPRPQGIPIPSRRSFQSPTLLPDAQPLSPPKNLVPSAHRRSISSSTCSNGKGEPKASVIGWPKDEAQVQTPNQDLDLNRFLKEQRTKFEKVLDGQVNAKAKIVLSDPSNSKYALSYSWTLVNRIM